MSGRPKDAEHAAGVTSYGSHDKVNSSLEADIPKGEGFKIGNKIIFLIVFLLLGSITISLKTPITGHQYHSLIAICANCHL